MGGDVTVNQEIPFIFGSREINQRHYWRRTSGYRPKGKSRTSMGGLHQAEPDTAVLGKVAMKARGMANIWQVAEAAAPPPHATPQLCIVCVHESWGGGGTWRALL